MTSTYVLGYILSRYPCSLGMARMESFYSVFIVCAIVIKVKNLPRESEEFAPGQNFCPGTRLRESIFCAFQAEPGACIVSAHFCVADRNIKHRCRSKHDPLFFDRGRLKPHQTVDDASSNPLKDVPTCRCKYTVPPHPNRHRLQILFRDSFTRGATRETIHRK